MHKYIDCDGVILDTENGLLDKFYELKKDNPNLKKREYLQQIDWSNWLNEAKVLKDAKNSATDYYNNEKESLAQQKAEISSNMKFDVADLANKLTTKLMGEGVAFSPLSENEVEEVMNKNV